MPGPSWTDRRIVGGMTSAPPETTLGGAPVLKVEID